MIFKNQKGYVFPHTNDSWDETLDVARLHGFQSSGSLISPKPGQSIPEDESRAMADALDRAAREELGEHSVLRDFESLLRGGGVFVVQE